MKKVTKLEGFVMVIVILLLIACVVLFILGNTAYQQNKKYLKYATVNGGGYSTYVQKSGDNAYNGLQIRNTSLILAVAIIINVLVANEFYNIACMKGHDERKYLLWSFLLLPLGILMVIALPDRKKEEGASTMEQTFFSEDSRQEIEKTPVPAQEVKNGHCACAPG